MSTTKSTGTKSEKKYRVLSQWNVDNPLVAGEYPWLEFESIGINNSSFFSAGKDALGVFLSKKKYDLLFAGGLRLPLTFAMINKVFFWNRIPVYVGSSVFLEVPARNPIRLLFQKIKANLLANGIEKMMILSSEEIEIYHKVWGIPKNKMEKLKNLP